MRKELQANECGITHLQSNFVNINMNKNYVELSKQVVILNELLQKEKEKANEKDKIKTAFLANMAHDIRTPINAIRGFADLLLDNELKEENKLKYIQIICQCSDKLLNLVNDLLDISKIEAGQLTIIERSGNIKDLFNELFELFSNPNSQERTGNVALEYFIELNPEQCQIDADFLRLRQVLINLIGNALKFTERGYVNYGCCMTDNKTLCFYVEDSGVGITPEKQAIIFDRFKQVNDQSSTDRNKGTGLGLSIVKQLIELMNGKVWVESTKGIGSRFYFTLPYKKTILQKAPVKDNVSYNWCNKNILILEDDDYDIALISKYLDKSKANCTYTKDWKSALEFVKSWPSLDLVLMDVELPGINGLDLVRKMKKISPHLPIIAQTYIYNVNDKELALNIGCINYLPKCTNKEDLLHLIKEQFDTERCFAEHPISN